MEAFHIAKLDTDVGILRVSGVWDPLTAQIIFQDIAQLSSAGWTDATFWLTEQNFEAEVSLALKAAKGHLLTVE